MLEEKIQEEAMSYIPEGLSCTKPPLFNGKNYYFWKGKIGFFLKSKDVDMVKYFWVRAEIYDKYAAKQEEVEKILLDPSLKGKTRAEMGLKEFTRTEIRSNLMGIPITINEEIIGRACRRKVEGAFQWDLNSKTSICKETVVDILFNGNPA